MLSPPFLAMEPQNYFCNENGHDNFESLDNWQNFSNVIKSDGTMDKCLVYDLDYTNYEAIKEAVDGSELTNQTRICTSWLFKENETKTLITDVRIT